MDTPADERNKAFVPEAFDTLANRRDFVAAERLWSPGDYVMLHGRLPMFGNTFSTGA